MAVKRVTRVKIGAPPESRAPTKVRLDHSLGGVHFVKGDSAVLPFDKIIKLNDKVIIARFVRIVVVETNDATENIQAVAMNE